MEEGGNVEMTVIDGGGDSWWMMSGCGMIPVVVGGGGGERGVREGMDVALAAGGGGHDGCFAIQFVFVAYLDVGLTNELSNSRV
jgi:hypothetical protein